MSIHSAEVAQEQRSNINSKKRPGKFAKAMAAASGLMLMVAATSACNEVQPKAEAAPTTTTSAKLGKKAVETVYPVTQDGTVPGFSPDLEKTIYVTAVYDAQEKERIAAYLTAEYRESIVVHYGSNPRPSDAHWYSLHNCEQRNSWYVHGSQFSGGTGDANSTWRAFRGEQFGPTAGDATIYQQIEVDNRIYEKYGAGAWGCKTNVG